MQQFTALPPLSLYIHLPWCVRKCPYCDFNSHEIRDDLPEGDYVTALLTDLDQQLPSVWGRSIHSVFIGGGTPSIFSPEQIARLISECRARLNLQPDIEITMEANPGTAEQEKFTGFRAAGVNRLSIGVQSFNDQHLQQLGRIHSAREAINAIEMAHKAGFEQLNLDLMYGLPQQTPDEASDDLRRAISLAPTHLSHYQLTIEPNTFFYHQPPHIPDDDRIADIEDTCRAQLADAGFARYEISAYAKQQQQCKHNMNYWLFGDYLGIGAGAHGKLTDAHAQKIVRNRQHRHPRDYMTSPHKRACVISPDVRTVQFEFMLNALRLIDGFKTDYFTQRTGTPIVQLEQTLHTAEDKGLVEWGLHHIKPTELGLQYLNDLTALFLPDDITA